MNRPAKKSETLEIRIPHDTKRALMDRSRAEGKPASEVVRTFIDAYLAEAACPPTLTAWERNMTWLRTRSTSYLVAMATITLAGAAGLALVASPASARPDLETAFRDLDANGDGVLDADEFGGGVMIRKVKIAGGTSQGDVTAMPVHAQSPQMVFILQAKATVAGKPVVFAVNVPPPADAASGEAGRFARMDRDKSGSLSFDEFRANHEAVVDRAFAAIDADRNGYLNTTEIGAANRRRSEASAILAAFDRDADGKLSRAELIVDRQ